MEGPKAGVQGRVRRRVQEGCKEGCREGCREGWKQGCEEGCKAGCKGRTKKVPRRYPSKRRGSALGSAVGVLWCSVVLSAAFFVLFCLSCVCPVLSWRAPKCRVTRDGTQLPLSLAGRGHLGLAQQRADRSLPLCRACAWTGGLRRAAGPEFQDVPLADRRWDASPGDPPLPGTSKTFHARHRVAWLVGVEPQGFLCLFLTRRGGTGVS